MITSTEDMLATNFKQDAIFLPLPEAFCFQEVLHYLSRSSIEVLHYIECNKIYKLLDLNGDMILIEVSQSNDSTLQITFVDKKPTSKVDIQYIMQYVNDWLGLNTDLLRFYKLAENDPLLKDIVQRYYGLRIIGIPDLFEVLCWAVIGQQINLTFAYTLKRRFVEAFGKSYEWKGRSFWLFPKASQLNEDAIEQLRKMQFTQKKAEYIVGIAEEIKSGNLSKKLMLHDLKKAERQLLSIRGIGPWTAHYAMMRCFRDCSAFPIGDVGLHNALKRLLNLKEKPTLKEIEQMFIPWSGWEAYVVFYLWRGLEDVE
ncbi:DNA-3-methyladenine glycosylase family protein [Shimazuella kribbensis]|uniref:DNA-3-methyladenine glycosylase family protein n=1 Tax=Shimazuella kribbensis TaxID=139808 RepID=UPI000400E66E|nr:DNA-3-methyladenine glycosylase [Shimazuella kribbensis]